MGLLAEPWWLEDEGQGRMKVRIQELRRESVTVARVLEDLSGPVAKAVDLTATITLALPTDRLHESA